MILDIALYVIGQFISWVALLLPAFSIYPDSLLNGLQFFGEKISSLDFFIFDIPKLFGILIFIIQFEIYYFTALKIVSIINFFRGGGKLEL
jgi:hypothetical protein